MAENAENPVFSRGCGTFPTFSDISEFQPIFHLFSIMLFPECVQAGLQPYLNPTDLHTFTSFLAQMPWGCCASPGLRKGDCLSRISRTYPGGFPEWLKMPQTLYFQGIAALSRLFRTSRNFSQFSVYFPLRNFSKVYTSGN